MAGNVVCSVGFPVTGAEKVAYWQVAEIEPLLANTEILYKSVAAQDAWYSWEGNNVSLDWSKTEDYERSTRRKEVKTTVMAFKG